MSMQKVEQDIALINDNLSADISQKQLTLEELRIKYLGRKSAINEIFSYLKDLSTEDKRAAGQVLNEAKQKISEQIASYQDVNVDTEKTVDYQIPINNIELGTLHPINEMIIEMTRIYQDLGFDIVDGNEIVTEKENFDMLNFLPDHPARDSHDTLNLRDNYLMRTHTSSVQVLEMQKRNKEGRMPIRIVVPGKTYRRESDATHSQMFHQMEGLLVDQITTMSDLKGILTYTIQRIFQQDYPVRFRPHYFPFTEPSAEMDILWKDEDGNEKWLEILGCGMVHPNVLKNAGINTKIYQGWAFGMAVERLIMIRHNIKDIRQLYTNSLSFLNQY